jgi:hypothetical protein
MPKIYYASRTHSQLSQSVNEIKNTKYKPIVSVLGSRDQLCIKPELKSAQSGSRTSLCKVAVKKQQCLFYQGHEDPLNLSQLKQEIMDIEDLVKFGESKRLYLLTQGMSILHDSKNTSGCRYYISSL